MHTKIFNIQENCSILLFLKFDFFIEYSIFLFPKLYRFGTKFFTKGSGSTLDNKFQPNRVSNSAAVVPKTNVGQRTKECENKRRMKRLEMNQG